MARLTASPNPIGVWGPTGTGTATVTWDTQLTNVGGVVTLSVDNVAQGPLTPPTGAQRNTIGVPLTVQFGHVYALTLLNGTTGQPLLPSVVVTVVDNRQLVQDIAVAGLALSDQVDPPQVIYDLNATVTVDALRVGFRTTRPAFAATVSLEASDGSVVRTALTAQQGTGPAAGLRHTVTFGEDNPLPQDTELVVEVTVPRPPAVTRPQRPSVRKRVSIRTGSRSALVGFDSLMVRNDSDTDSAGDFWFGFGASPGGYDVTSWAPDLSADIRSNDPPVPLNRSVLLDQSERQVYVYARGKDDDSPSLSYTFTTPPGEFMIGSRGVAAPNFDLAEVGDLIDLSQRPTGWSNGAFVLDTGDTHPVAFSINGHIETTVDLGRSVHMKPWRTLPFPSQTVVLSPLARTAAMGAKPGVGMIVAMDEDAGIWMRAAGSPGSAGSAGTSQPAWTPLAPWPGGPVTVIGSSGVGEVGEVPRLVALDAFGRAVAFTDGQWRDAGGPLVGWIRAVHIGESLLLVGINPQGELVCSPFDRGPVEWAEIADGPMADVVCLAGPDRATVIGLTVAGQPIVSTIAAGRWGEWVPVPTRRPVERIFAAVDRGSGHHAGAGLTSQREVDLFEWSDDPGRAAVTALGSLDDVQQTRTPESVRVDRNVTLPRTSTSHPVTPPRIRST